VDSPESESPPNWRNELWQIPIRFAVFIVGIILALKGPIGFGLGVILVLVWLVFIELRPEWTKNSVSPLRWLNSQLRYANGDPIQFGMKHILYCFAVIGSSLGLAGLPGGIILAVLVFFIWGQVFKELHNWVALNERNRQQVSSHVLQTPAASDRNREAGFTLVELLIVMAMVAMLVAFLFPSTSLHRHRHLHRTYSRLRDAFRAYEQDYGQLPPVCICDSKGTPMHSWRVLILPYIGQKPLYATYNFAEPWNSPNNQKLLKQTPSEFELTWRGNREEQTRILAVVPSEAPLEIAFLVDHESSGVPWTKPVDMSMDQATALLTRPPSNKLFWSRGFLWSTSTGHPIGLIGSGIEWVTPSDRREVEELAAISMSRSNFIHGKPTHTWREIHYGNMFRLVIFLIVALWPIRWVLEVTNKENRQSITAPQQ
jgi:prepilin-type N-terminal cleavage/methylation domain-containing protein